MAVVGLSQVQARIADACDRSGRSPDEVRLVAVSKNRSDADVLAVYEDGHRLFAENREQGLKERMHAGLPNDISWQFVGPLQSRKAQYVGAHVDLLQSMDRQSLAAKWAVRTATPVLIQFNMADEPQKSGFDPADADEVLDTVMRVGLNVLGVMAIPPLVDDPDDARPWFAALRTIFDRYRATDSGITICSMGMSHDLEAAISEGATMVRVGRAIFD
jgi:pyridoxal phosphate enzyme (YggS family)